MPSLDPDRWRAVSLRLDEALELGEQKRASWLAALREQDPRLAEDVRVLLEEHEAVRRKHFLEEELVFHPAGDDPDSGAEPAFAGRIFGAYRLVSPLGQGGAGVVWLAERCDGQFEGRAAVKLLDIARFRRSEARFRREATILARVTHPNIAHLLDVGVSPDGQPYLVLELVDGQPIDQYSDDRTLDVASRIRLFLDVLGAVSHAHAHRIVHRDIKPSNVLVRTDGHVKLLDFGIAKLLELEGQPGMATTLTIEHGAALTPAYAAPEQVAHGPVTTATDVYALGVMLYVLLTGQHPCGEPGSRADLFKAIVESEPPAPSSVVVAGAAAGDIVSLAASRATTPEGLHKALKGNLDTIVAKALKKAPQDRYVSVGDFADDLRRHLASEPIRARRDPLVSRAARLVRRHAWLAAAAAIATLVLGAVAGFYATRRAADPERSPGPPLLAPVPLTSEAGDEGWPSLSPDRTRVAFSWTPPNTSTAHLAVKVLASGATVQITDGPASAVSPVWSPDGRQIAFVRGFREPELRTQICLVSADGGAPRVLHTHGFSLPGLAWWEAGNALVFPTWRATSAAFQLAALDLATLNVRLLTNPPPGASQVVAPGDSFPAVAHDGRTIAFARETAEGRDIFLLDLVTRTERRLTSTPYRISGLTWAPDAQALIMSSSRAGVEGLYRVGLDDGSIVRVPYTGDGAAQPMADRGGVVFTQAQNDSNIYRIDLRNGQATGPARAIITSSRADSVPHISPDGRSIAFQSTRAGGPDIWVASADGTNARRLTFVPVTSGPKWSPDGRSIAFGAVPTGLGRPDIWIVDAGGGTPRRLTFDPSFDTMLAWAADSGSVYFISDRSGRFEIWNMPVRGGEARRVTHGGGLRAQESPDGRFFYYANDVPQVWRRSLKAASAEELVTTFPKDTHWGGSWIMGARGLYYLDERVPRTPTIQFLPLGVSDQGRAVRVTSLTAPATPGVTIFSLAPDESWMVWAQDDYRNSDIMLLEQQAARRR